MKKRKKKRIKIDEGFSFEKRMCFGTFSQKFLDYLLSFLRLLTIPKPYGNLY